MLVTLGVEVGSFSSPHPWFPPAWLHAGGAQQTVFELCSMAEIKSDEAMQKQESSLLTGCGGFKETPFEPTL